MSVRDRQDLCPGVLRPWRADDGGLVRLRLIGGRLPSASVAALGEVARRQGSGEVHLTSRANLQVRGLPLQGDQLPDEVIRDIAATGLFPSATHELARNVMVSPLTGIDGGRADLRPVATELDRLVCSTPALSALPGRFLFVLDDGRGDLVDLAGLVRRGPDLGLVALDGTTAQLRHGASGWGATVPLEEAAAGLAHLAERFVAARGTDAHAPWHVEELTMPLADDAVRDPRTVVDCGPPPAGRAPGGGWTCVEVPDGVLTPDLVAQLTLRARDLVVTPWRSVIVPEDPS